MGERSVLLWIMSASLSLIQLTGALTIDNQLAVIKNDCYERLAIGQRLHPRDIYEMKQVNTVPDCQQACTKEGDKCKSFSFGISTEGNGTCDLSMSLVRETVDLKPIGTVADTDYDLYIKKLGCKLVIEHIQPTQGSTFSSVPAGNSIGYNTFEYTNPGSSSTSTYKPAYEINSKPLYHDKPNYGGEGIHQVQTLISIRPSLGLKPIVEEQPGYGSSKPPPSSPTSFGSYPQQDFRPLVEHFDDSRPDYSFRPEYYSPDRVYNARPPPSYDPPLGYRPPRPMDYADRPYASRPSPLLHQSGYGYSRPIEYRPFEDDRPIGGYEGNQVYRPQRPIMEDNGYISRPHYPPLRPMMEESGYGDSRPPLRPINENSGYNSRPPQRPIPEDNGYNPNSRPPLRPANDDSGYNSRPPQRPIDEDNGYSSNSRPPLRPVNDDSGYNSRPPVRPIEDAGYNSNSRPIVEDNRFYSDDRRIYGPASNGYYQADRLDSYNNPDRPDYSPYSNPQHGGYGSSYGSQYSNYQPSKLTAIISDYDRLPRPIKTKPLDDDVSTSPYGVPNSYHRYPSFNRPVRPAYDTRPYEGDLPPYRPSTLNHPYHEHSYFRPGPPEYDPGPVRDPYVSQKPSYEVLMTKPPSSQEESGYRGNSLEPSKGVVGATGNGQIEARGKPVISYNVGKNGDKSVGIITEIGYENTCFRRALAGKRVLRGLVRRALPCERVEDCQMECSQEKRFVCEGFNYRLDPTGRGNGDCELLDMPLMRLDLRNDIIPDPDYDYYERNRNTGDCDREPHHRLPPPRGGDGGYLPQQQQTYDRGDNRRMGLYSGVRDRGRDPVRPEEHRGLVPYRGEERRPSYGDSRRYYFDDKRGGEHFRYHQQQQPFRPQSYLPNDPGQSYLPRQDKDRNYWGQNGSWGTYGGHYGNLGHFGSGTTYAGIQYQSAVVGLDDNNRRNYLMDRRYGNGQGQSYDSGSNNVGLQPPYEQHHNKQMLQYEGYLYGAGINKDVNQIMENTFPPVPDDAVEHKNIARIGGGYQYLKDECSLRSATGFRFHKSLVKKYFAVANIYECESLCFAIKEFNCVSYAFRYTVTLDRPTDNCYLSEKSYKMLDFYNDLQPDRDFDVYTMNNQKKCEEPMIKGKDNSDCFWHTRSGQRLDTSVIRDTLNVDSIVNCQLECLKSLKFTCRAFSFRYGSPIIGGSVDNCQLTDWPFLEIDSKTQLIYEPGFEVYERGSFGHGCEPNHFNMKLHNNHVIGAKTDQLCYVGYGTPARLAPQAIRKSVFVNTEFECKSECTKMRQGTLFQCMSFSFRPDSNRGQPNCDLSDILQRDLLSDIDYKSDPDSWLFAWDNYNPECVGFASSNIGNNLLEERLGSDDFIDGLPISDRQGYDPIYALDTWRVFSVSGWPCRRGSMCRENKSAGFWYCELEGGDANQWDYCCRPDHQCGYSDGFSYPWCYVGPEYTQWRKCSERYYPYIPNTINRHDITIRPTSYLPEENPIVRPPRPFYHPKPYGPEDDLPLFPGFRPDRPPASMNQAHAPRPSLNEYEAEFHNQFLEPPKPGGFAQQPRFWPVSYLHRTSPPNATAEFQPKFDRHKMAKMSVESKTSALENLLAVIKEHNEKNIQFDIKNGTEMNEILYVKIPLPSNITSKDGRSEQMAEELEENITMTTTVTSVSKTKPTGNRSSRDSNVTDEDASHVPTYRRGLVEKTNVTHYGKSR